MKLSVQSDDDNLLCLKVSGRIRMTVPSDQTDAFGGVLGEGGYARKVTLNLEDAEYIDSGGVSWLVISHRRFDEAGGKLVIHSTPVIVSEVLKVMRLDRILNLADDESAALALIEGEDQ
jgi:anti-anti-sigma factor